ncbi:hypothetical protein ACD661_04515 [Legionella lytica]|uniref:LegC3 N-terminal Legionellaceae domain-containing protein n=1 Tax=Legionella lytica TaxID=96232 RepID=A0ABW8D8D1_9GAMM
MLSDDKIIELVREKTYAYLSKSSYPTLRGHCLEQMALPDIMEQIRNHIDELVDNEKIKYSTLQIPLVCTRQQQQDHDETVQDTEEEKAETLLCIALTKERLVINDKLESIQQEKSVQEEILNNLEGLIETLKRQTHQLNTTNSSHEYSHSEEGHNNSSHAHPHLEHEIQYTHQIHSHFHSPTAPKELITVFSPVPAEAQSQLIARKELIEDQYKAAQQKLEEYNEMITKLTQRLCELNIKLTNEIPQKQQARLERLRARQLRETARLKHEPLQAQLSAPNYSVFVGLIHKFNTKKEVEGKQAIRKAEELSYREFLDCLINNLKMRQPLSLNFYEKEALEQIAQLMQDSLNVAEVEKNTYKTFQAEQYTKRKLDDTLSIREEELRLLEFFRSTLTTKNSKCNAENEKLNKAIQARLEERNKLLKIGAGVLLLTLMSALLVFMGGLELIFFTPSALCATVTLGLFITSLIYTAQNNTDRFQLKENNSKIKANLEKIPTQNEQINSLEISTIPHLKTQISEAFLKIENLKEVIEGLQKEQQLLIDKAYKVVLHQIAKIYPTASSSSTTELYDDSPGDFCDYKLETEGNSPRL